MKKNIKEVPVPDSAVVTKGMAINRLYSAGCGEEALKLEAWRNGSGDNRGWDGWIRLAYPRVISVIW